MARISGVDLPKNKKVLYGLQYIFGIGHHSSADILSKAKIDPDKVVSDLTEEDVAQIRAVITSEYKVEGALRSEVQQNVKSERQVVGPAVGQGTDHLTTSLSFCRVNFKPTQISIDDSSNNRTRKPIPDSS